VWRDTAGGLPNRRMLVVPESLSYPMMWLQVTMTPKRPGDPLEPVFMVTASFMLQGCDPNCEVEHCTTGDTLRIFTELDVQPFRQFLTGSSLGRFIRW
jgi:hypothetical protein